MQTIKKNLPGIAVCLAIAIPSWLLGKLVPVIGGPVFSILLGMVIALLWTPGAVCKPGVGFTSKKILQAAVVLLGFGLNLNVVLQTGKQSLPIIVCTITTSLLVAYQLSTHVLKGILQFDLLCDGHAVVGDQRCAILLVQNNIAALRTERDFYGISKRVDAVFQGLAGFIAPNNHFRHRDISLRLCYYSMIARISPALTMVYSSSPTLISVPAYLPTRT